MAEMKSNWEIVKTVEDFQRLLVDNLYHTHGQAAQSASKQDAYMALSYTVRDYLINRWRRTTQAHYEANPKFVYYLSAEYLPGKQLPQNMLYTDTTDLARAALSRYNLQLEDFIELDVEPGLGNGGLGRLAACFIDSLATLDIPAVGYGIRYEFGIFKQDFEDGWQVERPDEWLLYGNPWEFPQADDMVEVGFGGHTESYIDEDGETAVRWIPGEKVFGEPCTTLVPGYGTETVNILRLWRARATEEFDFQLFDIGDYARAVEKKVHSENISKVLYPNDVTPQGEELAAEATVLLRVVLAARHPASISDQELGLGPVAREGCHSVERYSPGGRHPGTDADSRGRVQREMGPGVEDHAEDVCLHMPHLVTGSVGEMAGRSVPESAATPSGDHLRDQSAVSERGAQAVPER